MPVHQWLDASGQVQYWQQNLLNRKSAYIFKISSPINSKKMGLSANKISSTAIAVRS